MMNVEATADEIKRTLRGLGRGSRQGHRPSAQADFGVYTQDLRDVVRTYKKRIAAETGEAVYQLALAVMGQYITECRQTAYELVAGHREARESLETARALAREARDLDAEVEARRAIGPLLLSTIGGAGGLNSASRMLEIAKALEDDKKRAIAL